VKAQGYYSTTGSLVYMPFDNPVPVNADGTFNIDRNPNQVPKMYVVSATVKGTYSSTTTIQINNQDVINLGISNVFKSDQFYSKYTSNSRYDTIYNEYSGSGV
ncbi:hypothetical protein, partial [Bacillus wiedmannii]